MTTAPKPEYVLTKTNFIKFLECRREFWLRAHHPEALYEPIGPDDQFRIRQGYAVERAARQTSRFKNGNFQFTHPLTAGNLSIRIDLLETLDRGHAILEVKSSKHIERNHKDSAKRDKREQHLYDIAFQVYAATKAGLEIRRAELVIIAPDYIRGPELDHDALLHFEDVTEEIFDLQPHVERLIAEAFDTIQNGPGEGFENLCSAKLRCPYFAFAVPELPETTIYDIPGLRGERFEKLKATGALAVEEIPAGADLTDNQWKFIRECESPPPVVIKQNEIEAMLDLPYPHYFLDYETAAPAIPQFEGMGSYEPMTFQFSLHVRETAESELAHHEFLADGTGEFQKDLAERLCSLIGDDGMIISWNKKFEIGQNDLLARLYPEHAEKLESINERMFDLGDIFSKKLYCDPRIKGWSIKNVLPVLVPEMSYEGLEIKGGLVASALWYMDVFEGTERKEHCLGELRKYCAQDTLAMVKICDAVLRRT